MKLTIPSGYRPLLDMQQNELAIKMVKDFFQDSLATTLRLHRTTGPLFVLRGTGINDDLSGTEHAVNFKIADVGGQTAEVVHSLAKWKRLTLAYHKIEPGEGIYTDMNAIRADEELDNLHSLYVDQWDWERVITAEERTLDFLKHIVLRIYQAMLHTEFKICESYPQLPRTLAPDVFFIHSEELRRLYPDLTPKERETAITREKRSVFIIGIGGKLEDGVPHDLRAPDYDDWSTPNQDGFLGLNGDLFVWHDALGQAVELTSMGIRVDKAALLRQLELTGTTDRTRFLFHKLLLSDKLPLSCGGGIGQSRLCMLFLQKCHIGEVQSSIWPEAMVEQCRAAGIHLL